MEGNSYNSQDWIKTLNIVKQNILHSVNVARLCKIKTISENEIICQDLNNSKSTIICTASLISQSMLQTGQIVCVLFTDVDYRSNLNRIKQGLFPQDTSNKNLHSVNYGIIVGILGGISNEQTT